MVTSVEYLPLNASGPSQQGSGRPLGAISTLVSLFLLLLVFFVMLVSMGRVEPERVGALLGSVDRALAGIPSRLGVLPVATTASSGDAPDTFVRDVETLLTDFEGSSAAIGADQHGLVTLAVLSDDLFRPGTDEVSQRTQNLVQRLAVLLQRPAGPGRHFTLHYRIAVPANAPAASKASATARAAAFATALYNAGCPAGALTIVLDPRSAGQTYLDFSLAGAADDHG